MVVEATFAGKNGETLVQFAFFWRSFTILSVNAGRSGYFLSLLAPEASEATESEPKSF